LDRVGIGARPAHLAHALQWALRPRDGLHPRHPPLDLDDARELRAVLARVAQVDTDEALGALLAQADNLRDARARERPRLFADVAVSSYKKYSFQNQ
jgi:hypothetical protein